MIPRRFISRTTSSPKGDSPPHSSAGSPRGVEESAMSLLPEWVSVM